MVDHVEKRLMRPLEAFGEHQQTVLEEMNAWASRHVATSDMFSLLPIDPDLYPAQRITRVYANGEPLGPEVVRLIADEVDPKFGELEDQLNVQEDRSSEVSRIGEDLTAGNKIVLVTNHEEDIKDVAEVLGVFFLSLVEKGYDFETALIMSKMISHLGIARPENGEKQGSDTPHPGEPAINILKNLCDRQYFSFPRTESTKESKIASSLITACNGVMRAMITHHHKRSDKGTLFAMAASGTRSKARDPDNPNVLTLGPIGPSAKLMMGEGVKVVPIAVSVSGSQRILEICDIPRVISDEHQANAVMQRIAETLTKRVPGKTYVYGDS